jgi:phage tail-like protein
MAVMRERPYANFNFLVDLGSGDSAGVQAGFSEIQLPEIAVEVLEYRTGNAKQSGAMKLPGRVSYGDLVLRRGLIGALDLYEWLHEIRQGVSARRTVTVRLQNEERTDTVFTWVFKNAFPVRYEFSDLVADGQSVMIESLTLAFEDLDIE